MQNGYKFNEDTGKYEWGEHSYQPDQYEVNKIAGTLKTPAKVLFDEKKELEELLRIDVEPFTDWCIEKDEEIELLYKIDGTKIPIEDFARTLYNKNKELKFI